MCVSISACAARGTSPSRCSRTLSPKATASRSRRWARSSRCSTFPATPARTSPIMVQSCFSVVTPCSPAAAAGCSRARPRNCTPRSRSSPRSPTTPWCTARTSTPSRTSASPGGRARQQGARRARARRHPHPRAEAPHNPEQHRPREGDQPVPALRRARGRPVRQPLPRRRARRPGGSLRRDPGVEERVLEPGVGFMNFCRWNTAPGLAPADTLLSRLTIARRDSRASAAAMRGTHGTGSGHE